MDWVFMLGFLWLLCIPSYVSAGVASVVLERACEAYRRPGTFLAYQGSQTWLKCSWNGTQDVQSFWWTLNGSTYIPEQYDENAKSQKFSLEVNDIHAGDWTCTVRTVDNVTAVSSPMSLELQGSLPTIVSLPSVAVVGRSVTLTCRHSIINTTFITWEEDGNSLYGLHRSWIVFNGDGPNSESITVNLVGETALSRWSTHKYRCTVTNELMCYNSARKMQRQRSEKKSLEYVLDIKYPIELELSTSRAHIDLSPNEDFNINCSRALGNQPSSVVWYKDGTPVDQLDTLQVQVFENSKMLMIYKAKPYNAGVYTCSGHNAYGNDSKSIDITVSRSDKDHLIGYVLKLSATPGVGEVAKLMCLDNYIEAMDMNKVWWYKDGVKLDKPDERYVYDQNVLLIPALRKTDKGKYSCKYTDKNHPVYFNSAEYQLGVVDVPPKPINLTVVVNSTTENSLIIKWQYSEGHDTNASSIRIVADFANYSENNPRDSRVENTIECNKQCPTQYLLRGLAPGTLYKIEVISINNFGNKSSDPKLHSTNMSAELKENSPDEYMKVVVGVVGACLVVFFALGYVFFRRHKKDYKKKVYDKIERELGFTIAKTLRPDPYEYDYNNLRFIDTLGEGAFGKVLKADAPGLKCPQGSQTVAVKMCRDDGENEYSRQELLSEIEILMKLGVHQHIIPLLGSCTKRGKPTCLITQYMPDGDLQNYLRLSRPSFVGTYPFRPQTADSFQINIHKMSNLCTSDDTLTSKDLISFARQIACGMEYVAAQKVVHRDLAARNVLVASKRSLKITDFGLAREMRGVNEEYVMGPNRKVPYRWLAPESFFEKKFTVHSDVWAYGVLLYEILTLGGSPYPRHTIRDIPEMLKKGYRMSPPTNSKPELNQLMSICWNECPESRPSFTEIKTLLDELLGDRPEEYLDCGDPDADILPNLNSHDNNEAAQDNLFRYSFLGTGRDIRSIAVQGYDRIADAHSAYNTLETELHTLHHQQAFDKIRSNPIPDTYQHLPVIAHSPDQSRSAAEEQRKNSAQYMNHGTGMLPVIVQPDFVSACQTEAFVAQKL